MKRLWLVSLLICGCAARQNKAAGPQLYVTPPCAAVKLKNPCLLKNNRPAEQCHFEMQINCVEVRP